jgi:hypothetical protein
LTHSSIRVRLPTHVAIEREQAPRSPAIQKDAAMTPSALSRAASCFSVCRTYPAGYESVQDVR